MVATRADRAECVLRWRGSGLTGRAFAAREGLNVNTLHGWSSKLGREPTSAAAFLEVAMRAPPATEGRIEVVLRDGVLVRVAGDFDDAVLTRVVKVLEAR